MKKIRRKWHCAKTTRNELKFCDFWVNIIADTFSNMSRYTVKNGKCNTFSIKIEFLIVLTIFGINEI